MWAVDAAIHRVLGEYDSQLDLFGRLELLDEIIGAGFHKLKSELSSAKQHKNGG